MASEDNIRRLMYERYRQPRNIFEEVEELEAWDERRKRPGRFTKGKAKTAELNTENKGYIWARGQKPLKPRSGDNDT